MDKIKEHFADISVKDLIYYFLIVFFVVIITVCLVFYFKKDDVSNFTSTTDNRDYAVRSGPIDGRIEAANYLATMSAKVDKLVTYMKKNNLPNQEIADRLYTRWTNCTLKETPTFDKSAAFTVNKGTEIRLCVRNGSDEFEDQNTSMFVLLHELAHIMSTTYGHNEEFKDNFNYIVHLASKLGIYRPENFQDRPKSYCGTLITSTPCSNGTCSSGAN